MANEAVLPEPFYTFFVYIEPFLTICGAIYAWAAPHVYYAALLPPKTIFERMTYSGSPQAGVMAVRQLGNCYLILACMSFFVLPKIAKLGLDPRTATSILRTFFAILAFADITHIVATLIDLQDSRIHVSQWNTLAHGNTTLVVGLFAFRMWYFAYSSKLLQSFHKAKAT